MPGPRIATLVLDGASPFEVGIAQELLGIARAEVVDVVGPDGWYDFSLVGVTPGQRLPTRGGAQLVLAHGLEAVAGASVVVVPASCTGSDAELPDHAPAPLAPPPAAVEALRAAHADGATVISYCSGSFVLAEAGLLDGRPATTHWRYADAFRSRFPRVRFADDVLYVDDGDVLTSAGSAAGIDLTLHWLRREHGAEVADLVARRMVVPPHRDGGQAQFVRVPPPQVQATSFAEVLEWVVERLDTDVSVQDMAAHAAMSPRSFARHFRAATGTTPHRWLTEQRVARARQLLETTDLSVEQVAQAAGLGTATNLRARLHAAVGVTPTAYRRSFARR